MTFYFSFWFDYFVLFLVFLFLLLAFLGLIGTFLLIITNVSNMRKSGIYGFVFILAGIGLFGYDIDEDYEEVCFIKVLDDDTWLLKNRFYITLKSIPKHKKREIQFIRTRVNTGYRNNLMSYVEIKTADGTIYHTKYYSAVGSEEKYKDFKDYLNARK